MKPRIVSLLPAATEIVHALGVGDALVGRSHECDYPVEVASVPALTSLAFPLVGSSREIDQIVKRTGAEGTSLYRLDVKMLHQLRPDVIITQGQCPVCAISRGDLDCALEDWPGNPPTVVSLAPARFSDLWGDFAAVAEALGVSGRVAIAVGPLKERVVSLITKTGAMRHRPKVACLEWLDPLMLAGNWVPDLIQLAGGDPLGPKAGEHSGWIDWDDVLQLKPDIVVLMPCGFARERTAFEAVRLKTLPGWNRLPAVQRKRVYAVDGSALFNRPGPRLVESIELLAHLFYPSVFPEPPGPQLYARFDV